MSSSKCPSVAKVWAKYRARRKKFLSVKFLKAFFDCYGKGNLRVSFIFDHYHIMVSFPWAFKLDPLTENNQN